MNENPVTPVNPITSAAAEPDSAEPMELDEDALLQQALAMSMAEEMAVSSIAFFYPYCWKFSSLVIISGGLQIAFFVLAWLFLALPCCMIMGGMYFQAKIIWHHSLLHCAGKTHSQKSDREIDFANFNIKCNSRVQIELQQRSSHDNIISVYQRKSHFERIQSAGCWDVDHQINPRWFLVVTWVHVDSCGE